MPAAAATAFGRGWVGGWAPEPAWDTAAATMGPGWGLEGGKINTRWMDSVPGERVHSPTVLISL